MGIVNKLVKRSVIQTSISAKRKESRRKFLQSKVWRSQNAECVQYRKKKNIKIVSTSSSAEILSV